MPTFSARQYMIQAVKDKPIQMLLSVTLWPWPYGPQLLIY